MDSPKELEYLDKILFYLRDAHNSEASHYDLYKHISGNNYDPHVASGALDAELDVSDDRIGFVNLKGTYFQQQRKFDNAIHYLKEIEGLIYVTSLLTYSLTFKGIVKSQTGYVHEFEKEFNDWKTVNENLVETTKLAIEQKADIKKANRRSIIAIVISILAIPLANLYDYLKDNNSDVGNGYHQSPPRKDSDITKPENFKKPFHDSLK